MIMYKVQRIKYKGFILVMFDNSEMSDMSENKL